MIIKRNQTNKNNNQEQERIQNKQNPVSPSEVSNVSNTSKQEKKVEAQAPLSFEDIVFDARQERRQGSRRRGYRRIDDRNIVSRAQEEANSIREQAIKEGHRIGIENAKQEIQELKTAIEEYFSYKNQVIALLAPHILEISVEIAKKIINKEIQQDKTALFSLIKSALGDTVKSENRITIKVMPQDVVTVREELPTFLEADNIEAKIKVVPDDNIQTGGAIIITENGIIDATIETGLSILEQAFKTIQQG
jgi:flagellar assembly protein FliH